ncbi:uncharacterized protein K444DRAFT_627494 [Hyaloscypha bicolor E]|uniref:Uncharacterized protein n=1 Tax=Hyaloscypha bicolor E TaxID=1095630 RepID=A0A2J6THV3_9HELO|nr:uncharacterized protein K444DRAFT_627494 [Hyaloscypha bicolor E]PMD62584.1 hypothetical protein K444DRAFT_627494 [Hyaloscypha bicolor E]
MSDQQAEASNGVNRHFLFIFNSIFEPRPVRISSLYRFFWECCRSRADGLYFCFHPTRRILLSHPICRFCFHQICPRCRKFVVRDDGDFEDQPGIIAQLSMNQNAPTPRSDSWYWDWERIAHSGC